jgi:CDP-glucose 4,6-dehydratase
VEGLGAVTTAAPRPAFWKGKRVLLTGHTGFKGAWAALWLTAMGAKVTGLALAPETDPNLYSLAQTGTDVDSHLTDLRDAAAVRQTAERAKPEIVLHMAAQALVRRSYREPADTFAANVQGTANVLSAVIGLDSVGAVLVVTSDKVYRNDGQGAAFAEDARLGGHDPYSASKAAAEIVAASYRDSFFAPKRVPLATARGGNVIGGGDFSEDRIVPDIWRAAANGTALRLRYPDATRPWQHVLDCLAGYFVFAEALAEGRTKFSAMNFGPQPAAGVPVRDLVQGMQGAMGAAQGWTQEPGALPPEMPALALDCGLADRELNWRSILDARETVEWTAAWYKSWGAGNPARRTTLSQIESFMARR